MTDHRDYAAKLQRLYASDDADAVGFARDYLKFGQWLNAGACAALPVIVGILELKGMEAAKVLVLPLVAFALGLVASAASTAQAVNAMSARADSRLSLSDMGSFASVLYDGLAKEPSPSEAWVAEIKAEIQTLKAAGERDHHRYVSGRWWALALANLSVALFFAGVLAGSVRYLW